MNSQTVRFNISIFQLKGKFEIDKQSENFRLYPYTLYDSGEDILLSSATVKTTQNYDNMVGNTY